MAKEKHQEPTSSKGALIALAIGALLVAGLVVWALTRSVEPAATTASADTAGYSSTVAPITETAPISTTATPTATTAPSTTAPIASTTAPITLTSNTPPPAPPTGDRSAVKRISAEDLREKMKSGNVVIVDVRDPGSYQTSHIAGAIHVPMSSIQANLDLIPKGKEIVTYCT